MLALSSTSASVTWVRPLEATLSSIRLRIKRRIRNGLRFILRSASGSQVIPLVSALYRLVEAGCDGLGDSQAQVVSPCGVEDQGSVLAGEVGREARRKIFLDHHGAFHLGVG